MSPMSGVTARTVTPASFALELLLVLDRNAARREAPLGRSMALRPWSGLVEVAALWALWVGTSQSVESLALAAALGPALVSCGRAGWSMVKVLWSGCWYHWGWWSIADAVEAESRSEQFEQYEQRDTIITADEKEAVRA